MVIGKKVIDKEKVTGGWEKWRPRNFFISVGFGNWVIW
jgi:hypothetical protein